MFQLSLVLLFMHSALIRCQSGNCVEGCLYSVLPPTCGNGGSTLRFKLNPSTRLPSGLDMCGTDCSKNSGTSKRITQELFFPFTVSVERKQIKREKNSFRRL